MKYTNKKHQKDNDILWSIQVEETDVYVDTHIPVLLNDVLRYLLPQKGESYLDLTAGYGGHALEILEYTKQPDKAVLIDRDQNAINFLRKRFNGQGVRIIDEDYLTAATKLIKDGSKFDIILADLGVSSPHLDNAKRGFSVKLDGPLDMRMDERQSLTAADIVNSYDVSDLIDIFRRYGEEPRAKKIAQNIVANRPIRTTKELAQIVTKGMHWQNASKRHPAIRVFQALRIAVNDELQLLEKALPIWLQLLSPKGRIAIISFHSLEDRIVKHGLIEQTGERYDAPLLLLTKQPVVGNKDELVLNPRARSAKLRAAVKK